MMLMRTLIVTMTLATVALPAQRVFAAEAPPLDRAEAAMREAQAQLAAARRENDALQVDLAAARARIEELLARPWAVSVGEVYQVWDDTKRQVHTGPLLIQRMVEPGRFADVVWLNQAMSPAEPPALPATGPVEPEAPPMSTTPFRFPPADLRPRSGSLHYNRTQRNRVVDGLDLTPNRFRKKGDDVRAVAFVGQGEHITIGPLRIGPAEPGQGYSDAITIEGFDGGRFTDVLIKQVWVRDSHRFDSTYDERCSGLFAGGVDGLVIEDSIFDRNGWGGDPKDRDIYSHNIYLHAECGPAIIRRTVISRASACGVQLRPGGTIEDSLIYANALGGYAARSPTVLRRCILVGNRQQFGIGSKEVPGDVTLEDCLILYVAPEPIAGIAEDPKSLWLQHKDSRLTMRGCVTVDGGPLKVPDAMKGDTREGHCSLTREQVYALCEQAATAQRPLAEVMAEIRAAVK